jgi:Zn-dependent peptidase ImmA (M78 family)
MRLPQSIRINGREVKLLPKTAAELPDAYGLWFEESGSIHYRSRSPREVRRDTLLHEVMHAVRYYQGREYGGEVEEDYVRSLATGILGVLDDNPQFAKWLIHK